MPRLSHLIIGAICMLVTAHLLIHHHVMNIPSHDHRGLPRRIRNYLENRRLHSPFCGSLEWRRLLYGPHTGHKYVWTAPLECNSEADAVVPERYTVYLHRGYSLLQHKHTLRDLVDLDQAIDHEVPGSGPDKVFETFYSARLNEAALAAVRADLGVDMVACEQNVYLDTGPENSSTQADEVIERMTEHAECLDRWDEIAAGADASEGEREMLEQRCGPISTWKWQEIPDFP